MPVPPLLVCDWKENFCPHVITSSSSSVLNLSAEVWAFRDLCCGHTSPGGNSESARRVKKDQTIRHGRSTHTTSYAPVPLTDQALLTKSKRLLLSPNCFTPVPFLLIFLQMIFVCVNIPDHEDSGEEALQNLTFQWRGAEPQRVVEAAGWIWLNVEDI